MKDDDCHYLKMMVHGVELSIYLCDIYRALGWFEEELQNSRNYIDITKQDSLADIQQI